MRSHYIHDSTVGFFLYIKTGNTTLNSTSYKYHHKDAIFYYRVTPQLWNVWSVCTHRRANGYSCMWGPELNIRRHYSGATHLGFSFETGPLISLDLSKWARLAEQQAPGACFYLSSPGTTSSPHSAFLHGFWGPNSGSHICVASTLQTELSSPTRRALTPMLWSLGNSFKHF